MDLLAELPDHAVWLRTVTGGKDWETACRCGFRSARTVDPELAKQQGLAHAETERTEPARAKPAKPATRRRR